MADDRELRVFISSTFQDLQEEREYLVKKVFPQIRSLCRERGITFTEVDLRWGLTEEDRILGQIVRTCLEEVDRCRPYFLGILGDRYGYTPELHEIYKDGELLKRFPWIEDAIMDGASIVDIEFRYGAIGKELPHPDDNTRPHAHFYVRSKEARHESDDPAKLEELTDRVKAAGLPLDEFRDPISLGDKVYADLLEVINTDFGNVRPLTPLELDRARHEAFAASRRTAYIPNVTYVKRLNDFAKSEEQPLVIHARSGAGKSSLVAYWTEAYRRKNPTSHIVQHYVGIGAGATDHFAVMRHIMEEIKERFEVTEAIPNSTQEIERQFANWLGFTRDTPIVIAIDAVNQLTGIAHRLDWLPKTWPKNIRLIISTTEEETLRDLQSRGWEALEVLPLTEKEREALIVRFLNDYSKALSTDQVRLIASDPKAAHPLFLRTLLEELRVFGVHEQLATEIGRYLGTTSTEELFQVVLERMEKDFGEETVRDLMSLIWATRSGLTENELQELTGFSRLKISALLVSLDYHLLRRDGLLTFFHDYLRRAVEERYLSASERKRERHLQLADYFEKIVMELAEKEIADSIPASS